MTGQHLFIFYAILLVAATTTALFIQSRLLRRRQEAKRKAVIAEMLELAQANNEGFDIVPRDKSAPFKNLTAILIHLNKNELELEVLSHISRYLTGTVVDVYFRAALPTGQVSYKFSSAIQNVEAGKNKTRLRLSFPADLDAGQKRNFIRVRPPRAEVRVIGIWKLDPATPIPRDTGEIGRPLIYYKQDMAAAPVQVEDISATGMALRFDLSSLSVLPETLEKDAQLLCLLIYHINREDRVVTFWCTLDVLHARQVEGENPALLLGTIFTNWAVLEQGKSEISWFHSTPARGVSPITQWVMGIDREQKKLL